MTNTDRPFNTKDKEEMSRQELWEELCLHLDKAEEGVNDLQALTDATPEVESADTDEEIEEKHSEIQIASTTAITHLEVVQQLHEEYRSR